MKKIIILFLVILSVTLVLSFSVNSKVESSLKYKNGDIIFQTSETEQCEAVRIATNSKFSHCGIIFNENGKHYVYEAVQPVSKTPLKQWIKNGKNSKYVVRRIKSKLSVDQQTKMLQIAKGYINKNYDIYFEWDDKTIYCSELVWKIYKFGGNIELCPTKKLKEFNLENPIVKKLMKQRYGTKIPLNEEVVAPSQLAETNELTTVFDNYKLN